MAIEDIERTILTADCRQFQGVIMVLDGSVDRHYSITIPSSWSS